MTLQEELTLCEAELQSLISGGKAGVVEWREGSKSLRYSETQRDTLQKRIDFLRSQIARRSFGSGLTIDPVR